MFGGKNDEDAAICNMLPGLDVCGSGGGVRRRRA
jgi:hypothetical protein